MSRGPEWLLALALVAGGSAGSPAVVRAAGSEIGWRELIPVIDDVSNGQALSETDAVQRALQTSRQLEALDNDVAIAEGRRESAGALRNPQLRVRDLSTEYLHDNFNQLTLGLRWWLPRLGDTREQVEKAEFKVTEARVEAARTRLDVAARVRHSYAELVYLEQVVLIRSARLALESRRLELVERMKDLGQRSVVYFTKARMRLGESRSELSRLEQRRNETRRDLARRVGLAVDAVPRVLAEPLPEQVASLDQLLVVASGHRPEEALVRQRRALALAQYERERLKRVPWINFVQANYHVDSTDRDWGELMLGIDLPLFNWNTGAIRATELDVARKETRSAALAERLENELRDRYAAWRDALLDWQLSTADAETLVSNARAIIEQAQVHETLPSDEVVEMQLAVEDAREIVCTKRFRLAEALIDLMRTVGVDEPAELLPDASAR
jgi:outer membrane protein TolC